MIIITVASAVGISLMMTPPVYGNSVARNHAARSGTTAELTRRWKKERSGACSWSVAVIGCVVVEALLHE